MYPKTERTTPSRYRERMSYDRATAHAILDEAYHCVLSYTVDGEPRALPMMYVRVGETLYVHGSTGGTKMLAARDSVGLPVCVTVALLDGLIYARSQFHHSANYRSVIAHGHAHLVTDEREKWEALTALVDKLGSGRSAQTRPLNRKELAQTAVLALPLREVSTRSRTSGVNDDPEDLVLPIWAGVVPLRLTAGLPAPDTEVTTPIPDFLRPRRSPWLTPAPMYGQHVILEPLDLCHVDEMYAATNDPQTWQHLGAPQPRDRSDMRTIVADALAAHLRGERVPWVQRCATTGVVVGTTSFYEVSPEQRSLAIGYTHLGRPWWRTGVNTEAKLLLLTRAFEELGALRVVWHTDIRNTRSQQAIERLGAQREGVLRMHRQRNDGTWRDTVQYSMIADEWPEMRARLQAKLRPAG